MSQLTAMKIDQKEKNKPYRFSGALLYKMRYSKGYSMKKLAKKLRRCPSTIHYWEIGKNCPNAESMSTLCKIFGTTVDSFLVGPKDA